MFSANQINFGALPSYRLGIESYDQEKLGLGSLMIQKDDYAGPLPLTLARPVELSTAIPGTCGFDIQWSDSATSQIDWYFYADAATAAATRRVALLTFNRLTADINFAGFITVTFPTTGNVTIRSMRLTYDKHTVGTVGVSGTAVTGTTTSWKTDGACVGNRIGFGSTDPAQISTWYEISAIGTDTGITLTSSAGTIAGGTPYVIEDLRIVLGVTNATAGNGGPFLVKGLSRDAFTPVGTVIPAATTVDNIRACYWLKDAAVVTNTVLNGMGLQEKVNFQTQYLWAGNGTTTQQLFKHNIRAALTLTAGAATNQFLFSTAVSATLTGTASQSNNGRVANPNHGPGIGVDSYYFTTTTRVYRTKPLSTIASGDTTFLTSGDFMNEVPPGSASTQAASGAMSNIEYSGAIDRFIIGLASATTARDYVTRYKTDGTPFDRQIGVISPVLPQLSASVNSVMPFGRGALSTSLQYWIEGGLCYAIAVGATSATSFLFVTPISTDWDFAEAGNRRIITPRIATPTAKSLESAYFGADKIVSESVFGISPEPYRAYYRTTGISDNSGSWTLIPESGSLSGIAGASHIQFMFEFRMMGQACLSPKIHSAAVLFDTGEDLPAELAWNTVDIANATSTVATIQTSVFSSLASLTIDYRAESDNSLLLSQISTGSTNGVWEYYNGSAWVAGLGSNAVGTRRRFTPSTPLAVNSYATITAA